MPLRWPLELAAGCALVVAGLSTLAWPGYVAGAVGMALVAMSLRHVLPPGTLTGRPGLPAAVAGAFLLSLAFFTADSFVPLVITGVRGRSLTEAGVAVTLVAVSWSVATFWQARMVDRFSYAWMVRTGSLILAGGTAVFALAIAGAPLPLAYAAWTVAGAGMGIAFTTLWIATMNRAGALVGSLLAPLLDREQLPAAEPQSPPSCMAKQMTRTDQESRSAGHRAADSMTVKDKLGRCGPRLQERP